MNNGLRLKTLSRDFQKAIYENKLKRQNRVEIRTCLSFLLSVNGLRRSSVAVVLGNTSSGKSTLVRSIIADVLTNNKTTKVSCFLSEETVSEYKTELFKAFKNTEFSDRMFFYSEQDFDSEIDKANSLTKAFSDPAEVLIYDNITTSSLYSSKTPQDQTDFSNRLKAIAKKTNKALICVAHTNHTEKNGSKLVSSSDVRGSKNISNIAEFFFINHQFSIGESSLNFVEIEKHRGQSPEGKFFQLGFNRDTNLYESDFPISFQSFKECYKTRNKI